MVQQSASAGSRPLSQMWRGGIYGTADDDPAFVALSHRLLASVGDGTVLFTVHGWPSGWDNRRTLSPCCGQLVVICETSVRPSKAVD